MSNLKARIEALIIAELDRSDHWCIAYSEVQRCCIDPRLPKEGDYGGEAIKHGLLDAIVAEAEAYRSKKKS